MKMANLLRRQPPNRRVILATLPCVAGGVYFFGWRSLAMVLLACGVGLAAEYWFCRRRKEPVSEAVFVTAILFALILPPTVGWHVIIVGMLVAIVFAKELFGGFGRNIFNPAMAGRCFVYICYPIALTAVWPPNAFDLSSAHWYGALDRWSTQTVTAAEAVSLEASNQVQSERTPDLPPRWNVAASGARTQAYTGATPLGEMKRKQLAVIDLQRTGAGADAIAAAEAVVVEDHQPFGDLLLGTPAGTTGVTSAVLILLGGLYLIYTKTANRTIVLSVIISCYVLAQTLTLFGVRPGGDGLRALLSGGFLFGAFFMATDPISSAKTPAGRIVYGSIIGTGRVIIQNFSVFNGGFMFALLLANMFAPSIDALVRARQAARKARVAAAPAEGAGA